MMTLEPAVWQPTARTRRIRGKTVHMSALYHAVRGDRTLCGLTASDLPATEDIQGTGNRCPDCSAVPDGHFTAHDIVALGPTYRQVEYWRRQGWLVPDNPRCGSGQRMTFPPSEALTAVAIWQLTKAGVAPSSAHRAARNRGMLGPGIRIIIETQDVSL